MDNSNLHWLAEYEQYGTGKKANNINTYAQAMRSFPVGRILQEKSSPLLYHTH